MRRNEIQPGWLTNNGGIPSVTPQQAGKGAYAAILFSNHALHHQRAIDRNEGVFDGFDCKECGHQPTLQDRKSTRLNSSHANISYAVFCLKQNRYLLQLSLYTATPSQTC